MLERDSYCLLLRLAFVLYNDERQQKIRLVFKTPTWLQTCFRFTSLIPQQFSRYSHNSTLVVVYANFQFASPQGKELARPYQAAVLSMVPTTPFDPKESRIQRHESINDLPVHPATLNQIFHPTSESRHFTRADAGKVFHPDLMPADDRIPHPEMIEAIKDRNNGMNAREVKEAQQARIDAMAQKRRDAEARKAEQLVRSTTVVEGKRWDFKFVDCKVDATGKQGRSPSAVGWRYGFPHEDRKKGQIKIQTKVEY